MIYTKDDLRQDLVPMLSTLASSNNPQAEKDINAVADTIIAMFVADRKATLACALEIVQKIGEDDG